MLKRVRGDFGNLLNNARGAIRQNAIAYKRVYVLNSSLHFGGICLNLYGLFNHCILLFSRIKKCRIRRGSEKSQNRAILEVDTMNGMWNAMYWCVFIFCYSDSSLMLTRAFLALFSRMKTCRIRIGSEKGQNCSILEVDTRDGMGNAMCFHILLLWLKFHGNPSICGTLFSRMKQCRIRIGSEKDQKYLFLEFDARYSVGNVIYWCDFIFCFSDSNLILIRALFSAEVLFDYEDLV